MSLESFRVKDGTHPVRDVKPDGQPVPMPMRGINSHAAFCCISLIGFKAQFHITEVKWSIRVVKVIFAI